MVDMHHIQYPVGQGGLHLGIIDDYAYIYDCGGYGANVNWIDIFQDIENHLSQNNVKTLDIFISHLHRNHYDKTEDLISVIYNKVREINIYIPPMSDIEKIMLICEYHITSEDFSDEKLDNEYIQFVLNGRFAKIEESEKIKYTNIFANKQLTGDIILHSYTTNISSYNQKKFINELIKQHINPNRLTYEIHKYGRNFWQIAINTFKNAFKIHRITNQIMLNLYCGMSYPTCCRDKLNLLHTGDSYLKTYKQVDSFIKAFGVFLSNVNFAQVPHHCSKNNHDLKFLLLFNCNCCFYYTTQAKVKNFNGIVVPYTDYFISLPCRHILTISDIPSTIYKLSRKV